MKYLFLITCWLIAGMAVSQELKSVADEYYQQEKWTEAGKAYKKYLKKNDQDSSAWYRLAYSQYKTGRYDEALGNYDKALSGNFYPGFTLYQKSKVYAALSQTSLMYETLSLATQKGFSNFKLLESEEDWVAFQDDKLFLAIVQRSKENAFPCLTDSIRRHFDFWIGEWDVLVNGQKVGENSITMAEGGCAIHESYTTAGIFSGQSINYYQPLDKKWHQLWVASGGNVLDYTEVDKSPGMLQFIADYLNPAGQVVKSRLTFTQNEDGSVRQFFENSNDGGTTWTPGFDGHYVKKQN